MGSFLLIEGDSNYSYPGQLLAAAVVAKSIVRAGSKQDLQFVLSWDQPFITFGSDSGLGYCRLFFEFKINLLFAKN